MVTSLLKKYDSLKPELINIQLNAADKAIELNKVSISRTKEEIIFLTSQFESKPEIIKEYTKSYKT